MAQVVECLLSKHEVLNSNPKTLSLEMCMHHSLHLVSIFITLDKPEVSSQGLTHSFKHCLPSRCPGQL
jgi:hypothetical protein